MCIFRVDPSAAECSSRDPTVPSSLINNYKANYMYGMEAMILFMSFIQMTISQRRLVTIVMESILNHCALYVFADSAS